MNTLTSPAPTRPRPQFSLRRCTTMIFAALLLLLLAIQLVPYGRSHSNPPVTGEPPWDSAQTRARFMRACADCHSNETVWPWYSNIAPVSWLIARDVDEGRRKFNISAWGRPKNTGDEAAENVQTYAMPPWFYLPLHAEANLSRAERQQLVDGLIATFGSAE